MGGLPLTATIFLEIYERLKEAKGRQKALIRHPASQERNFLPMGKRVYVLKSGYVFRLRRTEGGLNNPVYFRATFK